MEDGETERDYEAEKDGEAVRVEEERPSGIINQIFSNLVSRGREEENPGSGDNNNDSDGEVRGGEEEEKEGGGLISHFISNYLVSPLSPKGCNEKKVEDFETKDERTSGGGGEIVNGVKTDEEAAAAAVGVGGEIVHGVKTEEEGGGGGEAIIDKLVSHLTTNLADDADPATDVASILIHSIVHD
ncbi:uncharacterized protein LOC130753195 isoform X2 [Actinidia eriantha]|uniref:uncharacterized protein LOC130753195 isoform X2 n=1 Tax=Actinidia eriantha TaxID=165200 RepID=UPI0025849311|nr:uncharacterized protein LOC130753195 isoform X2 [Actinidia eriantha]